MTSIQKKITLNLILGAIILMVIAGLSVDHLLRDKLKQEFDKNLLSKAMVLASLAERETDHIELDFVSKFMPEFDSRKPLEYYEVHLENGELIDLSLSLGGNFLPTTDQVTGSPQFLDIILPDGEKGRMVVFLFLPRLEEDGEAEENESENEQDEEIIYHLGDESTETDIRVSLALAKGVEELEALVLAARLIIGTVFLILVIGLVFLVRYSVAQGLKPLRRISNEVRSLDAEKLYLRISQASEYEELEPITRQLNNLLARLDSAFQREKRFSGDVAHELKTPIAELRAMSEVGKEWANERELVEGFFGDLVNLADDMERTVTNLLTLARLDAGTQILQMESANLSRLVDDIWHRLENDAAEKGIDLQNSVAHNVNVQTDKDKLRLILINILSNAIKYSPNDTTITVDATEADGAIKLSVTNVAIDLSEQDLKVMFERFWRKDQSRSGAGHAGLGLSLVKALSEVLNLNIKSLLGKGSRFTVSLSGLTTA